MIKSDRLLLRSCNLEPLDWLQTNPRNLEQHLGISIPDHAFIHPFVTVFQAHTLAAPRASTRVLEKVGMKQGEAFHDPEDGNRWRWQFNQNDDEKE